MLTIAVLINGEVIFARSACRVADKKEGLSVYKIDQETKIETDSSGKVLFKHGFDKDCTKIKHDPKQGALILAKMVLDLSCVQSGLLDMDLRRKL